MVENTLSGQVFFSSYLLKTGVQARVRVESDVLTKKVELDFVK